MSSTPTDSQPLEPSGHKKRPTIYDVAQAAGVSKSLVSLVLHNSPRVSETRKQAVLAAIKELNYMPSRAATVLAGNQTRSIGVIVDDFRNPWFIEMLAGIRQILSAPRYYLSVADVQLNAHLGQHPIQGFLAMGVDGLIIGTDPQDLPIAPEVPSVIVGGFRATDLRLDIVANNDSLGGQLATERLLTLGHRHTGFLSGFTGPAQLRCAAYAAAMNHAGLEPLIFGEGNTDESQGYYSTQKLLHAHPEVTAIFAANDIMALGALAALRDHRRSVPDDVSVIGYDNSAFAQSRYLDLSSVDYQGDSVGIEAANTLLHRINEPEAPQKNILIRPELVLRSSTAPPPPGA